LRDIASELAQRGIMNERGVPFSAASINAMLANDRKRGRFGVQLRARRRQPRLASIIRPGRPAPAMGPGTETGTRLETVAEAEPSIQSVQFIKNPNDDSVVNVTLPLCARGPPGSVSWCWVEPTRNPKMSPEGPAVSVVR
jgi:hypothetical protein